MSDFPYVPLMTGTTSFTNPNKGSAPSVYLDASPYPKVDSGSPDPDAVAIIKGDRSSSGGELTAVLQYLYQNSRITNNEAIATALLQISIVEMMHLDMLGDAIQALGGKPSYDDGGYYWQAGAVNYADSLVDMIKGDIASEEGAIAGYEQSIAKTTNDQLKALFRRIIDDEKLHLKFFKELLGKLEA